MLCEGLWAGVTEEWHYSVMQISGFKTMLLRKAIYRPVSKASKEAACYADEHVKSDSNGEISKYEVISNLGCSIDSMEKDMVNCIENLTATTAEKERIGAKLSVSVTIQKDFLLDDSSMFAGRDEFDIHTIKNSAEKVGGYFYYFYLINDDHLAIVMVDVSDKGVPVGLRWL